MSIRTIYAPLPEIVKEVVNYVAAERDGKIVIWIDAETEEERAIALGKALAEVSAYQHRQNH